MKEYITTYLDLLENPDLPTPQRRGYLDILSRVPHYMEPEEIERYNRLSAAFHERMNTLLSRTDLV